MHALELPDGAPQPGLAVGVSGRVELHGERNPRRGVDAQALDHRSRCGHGRDGSDGVADRRAVCGKEVHEGLGLEGKHHGNRGARRAGRPGHTSAQGLGRRDEIAQRGDDLVGAAGLQTAVRVDPQPFGRNGFQRELERLLDLLGAGHAW